MNNPTLYILCGLPFSGKSTFGKALSQQIGAEYIGFDTTWEDMHDTIDEQDKDNTWRIVRDYGKNKARTFLIEGKSVVYDETNVGYDHRQELRDFAQKAGVDSTVVYINTPKEIISERMHKNITNPSRHNVEEENLKNAYEQFHEPQPPEKFVEYRPEMTVEEFVSKL